MLQDILVPLAAVGGLGLVMGLLLAFASKKFSVEVDPKVAAVRDLLGGANCGACGFPGCAGLASALAEGSVPVSACPVASSENKAKIAEILGIESGDTEPVAAFVLCQGGKNCKDNYDYIGVKSCAAAKLVAGGPKGCAWGCMGFGDCVAACPFGALSINENGVAHVDMESARPAGSACWACPVGVIQILPQSNIVRARGKKNQRWRGEIRPVCTKACIGCGICVKQCEFGAITLENNLARIDPAKCTACLACAKKCPTGAIVSPYVRRSARLPRRSDARKSLYARPRPVKRTGPCCYRAPLAYIIYRAREMSAGNGG